jgi:hypothetical protein
MASLDVRDFYCVKCGAKDGTIVPCHYSGDRKALYGKGLATKVCDLLVAALCYKCHKYMDGEHRLNKLEHSELFLHLIALTLVQADQLGYRLA